MEITPWRWMQDRLAQGTAPEPSDIQRYVLPPEELENLRTKTAQPYRSSLWKSPKWKRGVVSVERKSGRGRRLK